MKISKTRLAIGFILSAAFGFIVGYMLGFYEAINIVSIKAAKFISVNQSIIRDYLIRYTGMA